jgi:cyclic-di-AMP phosphodiesterase PgpH
MSRPHAASRRAGGTPSDGRAPPWGGMLFHGIRAALLVATAVAIYLFFPAPRIPDAAVLERNTLAPQDVFAELTFQIPKAERDLVEEQAEAAASVPVIYDYAPAALEGAIGAVRALFAALDSAAAAPPGLRDDAVRDVLERNRIQAPAGGVALLLEPQSRATLRRATETSLRELLPRGVVATPRARDGTTLRIRRGDAVEQTLPVDSVLTPERVFALAAERLPADARAQAIELQRLILIRTLQPSLVRNDAETAAARARARAAVDPVKATVLRGERIVSAHDQIGEREEERLRAYQAALTARGVQTGSQMTPARMLGGVLYNLLVLLIFGLLLRLFRRPLYEDTRAVIVFALLCVVVAGAAALIARHELPVELIPVPFAALIVAVLWEGRLALAFALVLALVVGGQQPFAGLTVPFTAAVGGAAAAFSVSVIERRSKTWLFISIVAFAYAATALTMGLLRWPVNQAAGPHPMEQIGLSIGWGVVNAIVASILAIGFVPLLEGFTRITTNQTLLELSDPNGKLLKRLSMEAPGSYAHTISVANLAEAGAYAIGANGLLARVGTYYHDVGKLVKPHYFVENQPRGRNPHDKLKPATSASIIRSHITDGLKLAEEAGLPPLIRAFIAEHHGTQQISFFLDRAPEADPDGVINPADYSYPGPRPQSKETAILMIADSVESATRVLVDPTPEKIRELVDRIVAGKISAGQLDECPLTLRELEQIKEALAKVLTGMYHHRIDYPPAPTAVPAPPPSPTVPLSGGAEAVATGGSPSQG